MIWDQVRGHAGRTEMFRRSLSRGRLSHAYLFAGPDGVGKQLFAKTLAQCLFCQRVDDADLDACGECSGCKSMRAGTHPDFLRIGCPEGKRELPIELLIGSRERRGKEGLCYELSLRPMASHRRIALIDDANTMNEASANALLKTLEEPPSNSLLILVATNADGLLPTIRSRCQLVRFSALSQSDLADLLRELELASDPQEADELASLSEGSLGTARQLLDPGLRELRNSLYNQLANPRFDSLATSARMMENLEKLGSSSAEQRSNAGWLVRFCLEFYRRAMLRLSGMAESAPIPQVEKFLERFQAASSDPLDQIGQLIDCTVQAEGHLYQHMAVSLCLEGLFNELARIGRSQG